MLFPFAPFLVKFLLPDVEETDVGESDDDTLDPCTATTTSNYAFNSRLSSSHHDTVKVLITAPSNVSMSIG